ncbi:homocysteine S-methyltransferase family protein [Pseudoflavonifractor phocaeensis]|nr:homocysteine S-methyltransferase family protein [Pseudoflavonifractor phocaeensis]MDM8239221.1 homocysteine S-methyltransferase family protein [Pseudoflavonifractor phocaeensis]
MLGFEEAVDLFAQVVKAGVQAGADLIAIETMTDLQEARAALLAAKENSNLPVLVTMTYEASGRTFLGCSPAAAALTLEGLGADAVGVNCSLGPREMPPLVEELLKWTNLPIVLKPNAGLPHPDGSGYDITPLKFAQSLAALADMGVKVFGGCCGTTPKYIALLTKELEGKTVKNVPRHVPAAVCSATQAVPIDRVRVIGERINPTGKKLMKEALRRGDVDYMLGQALAQTEAGADILDVNVGLPEIDEGDMMVRTVKALQGVTDAPLQLDSTDPKVLERALRVYCGKAIVNSVNGESASMETILPLVKKYGAAVVGLTLDENGIPKTAQARFDVAKRILERAMALGIRKEDVYIDCLTLTVSAEQAAASQTLEALHRVKTELGLKTVLGVSNISFGLPARPLVNQNFLTMAMSAGLDLPIINPNVDAMMAAVRCFHLLTNVDTDAREFIAAYANASVSTSITVGNTPAAPQTTGRSLKDLVVAGLKGEAGQATRALLETTAPMDIVDNILIPALDQVGADFEQNKVFLPQLIQSAGAAQAAFEVIREKLSTGEGGNVSRGNVVLATVKGDIHDIGKNIVKVLLENYGYTVIDLGRDVDPAAVVEAARKYEAPLVGLSALMTTTLKSMAQTIAQLHDAGLPCKIMVGGAVLTPEYAQEISADFYARDAKESVDIAKRVVG